MMIRKNFNIYTSYSMKPLNWVTSDSSCKLIKSSTSTLISTPIFRIAKSLYQLLLLYRQNYLLLLSKSLYRPQNGYLHSAADIWVPSHIIPIGSAFFYLENIYWEKDLSQFSKFCHLSTHNLVVLSSLFLPCYPYFLDFLS